MQNPGPHLGREQSPQFNQIPSDRRYPSVLLKLGRASQSPEETVKTDRCGAGSENVHFV